MRQIIAQHPATWHLYKARASTQLATPTNAFPDEIVEATASFAQQTSLEAMAQMVR